MSFTTVGTTTLVPVAGGPLQVSANSANPSNPPTLIALDANGNMNIPGNLTQNSNGNSFTQDLLRDFLGAHIAAATSTIIPGASTTNSFNTKYTAGSVACIQSATGASTGQQSGGMFQVITMGVGYPGNGAPFTLNAITQYTGGGSVSTIQLNAQVYQQLNNGTVGAAMTNGTAVTVGTLTTTQSFVCTPGTAAPLLQANGTIVVEFDFNLQNVSGSNVINILGINLT